jgi:AraC-like DNA-binding protein
MPLRLHLGSGNVMVLGQAGDSGHHAHRAAQLAWSAHRPLRLSVDDGEQTTRFVVLAPQQRHRIRGEGQPVAHLFIDCGARIWRRWLADGGSVAAPDIPLTEALSQALDHAPGAVVLSKLARRWRECCLPGLPDASPDDPRILRAAMRIDADPAADNLSYRALAQGVALSPSRFLTLFREQQGMPVRNYVLWRRLLMAVSLLREGNPVTEAAHQSGFADAAHLSRSFRRVIGASPSELRRAEWTLDGRD